MFDAIAATIAGLFSAIMTAVISCVAIVGGAALICWGFDIEMPSLHWPDTPTLLIIIVMWISIGNMIRLDIDYRWQRRKMQRRRFEIIDEILAEKRKA